MSRDERLTSRKSISSLFDSGRRVDCYPLRIIYISGEAGDGPDLKMAVSVPKRLFKRAVDRNLLKRRIREAFRLQKPDLTEDLNKSGFGVEMVIQYKGREIESFQLIEKKLQEALLGLKKKAGIIT